mmetsp:Transcript_2130/g.4634  ORF Transcript_2130/g.4634 Transcript_2130/m.4634 type:complete len:275 (+) Transcript_2130:1027-1851(+)
MLPEHVRVVAPEASPAERDAAGAGGFAGRHEDGVLSAAAEWLALASCDIVVGSQGSAYSLTASMRSGGLAVVLAPGSGVAIASTGEIEFLEPSYLTRSQYGISRCTDDYELRAWGLEEHVFCIKTSDEGQEEDEVGEGETQGALRRSRRLHIGRTTTAGTLEAGNSNTEWTVVDAVPGPGVVEVSDMSQLPFDADRFDVVYASHCLEHAPWDSLEATLNEWRRVLARGGTLCVAVPDMVAMAKLIADPNNNAEDDLQLMSVGLNVKMLPFPRTS